MCCWSTLPWLYLRFQLLVPVALSPNMASHSSSAMPPGPGHATMAAIRAASAALTAWEDAYFSTGVHATATKPPFAIAKAAVAAAGAALTTWLLSSGLPMLSQPLVVPSKPAATTQTPPPGVPLLSQPLYDCNNQDDISAWAASSVADTAHNYEGPSLLPVGLRVAPSANPDAATQTPPPGLLTAASSAADAGLDRGERPDGPKRPRYRL